MGIQTIGWIVSTLWLAGSIAHGATESDVLDSRPARPATFEENRGQFGNSGDFLLAGDGFNFWVGSTPIVELFRRPDQGPDNALEAIRIPIEFPGSRPGREPVGQEPAFGRKHYLTSADKSAWRRDIRSFRRVVYPGFYEGIDLEFRATGQFPEFVFHVEPGADPESLAMVYGEEVSLRLDENGALVLDVFGTQFRQRAPRAWQEKGGRRTPVDVAYGIRDNRVVFELDDFDQARPLVIDPVLEFSSYFGGAGDDQPAGVHTDADGNIYLVGVTGSTGLATTGAFDTVNDVRRLESVRSPICSDCSDTPPGGFNVERVALFDFSHSVFVTKFSPGFGQRLWTTYLQNDSNPAASIGINSTGVSPSGEVAFGIHTAGEGWPVFNPTQVYDSSQKHAYIAKLNPEGSDVVFATYLQLNGAGTFQDIHRGLAVGPQGQVAAVGAVAAGNNLPELNPIPGQTCIVDTDAGEFNQPFVTVFDADGDLAFSTCIGGDEQFSPFTSEWMRGVDIGPDGRIYTLGFSPAENFPLVNPLQATISYPGARDMTISVIDPSSTPASLEFSTYFGPSGTNAAFTGDFSSTTPLYFPYDIKVASDGTVVVTGATNMFELPMINAFQPGLKMPRHSYNIDNEFFAPEAQDMHLARINVVEPSLLFSTYLGGSLDERGFQSLAVDDQGGIYVSTVTGSADYPTASAIQETLSGDTNLGVTKLSADGKLVWSTYLGGSNDQMFQVPGGIALDPITGKVVLAAWTASSDFPLVNAFQASPAGGVDVALAVIDQSGDVDSDLDGVIDTSDAFPADAAKWRDTDGDAVSDNVDPDIDDDGSDNLMDAFPRDPLWSVDRDRDGVGDASDLFPTSRSRAYDLDSDGVGDFQDPDVDGDGVANEQDAFPDKPEFSTDLDEDGIADAVDPDIDGDEIANAVDGAPNDPDYPVVTFNLFDPFDTDRFKSPLPEGFSTPDGSVPWTSVSGIAFGGNRSLGTRPLADGQSAVVRLEGTFETSILSFRYKVDSQPDADLLRFFVDGIERASDSGDTGWVLMRFPLSAGDHTLEWRYEKDASDSVGLDAAWIDDIEGAFNDDIIFADSFK